MEKILRIEEEIFTCSERKYATTYEGYLITTDKQTIKLGISDGQDCCENSGYFMTNDDLSDFIGADLLGVSIVDDCLNAEKLPDLYEGDIMFVNLETDRGILQFTAYNEHNGYYSHEAVVVSNQFNDSNSL